MGFVSERESGGDRLFLPPPS
ncbi:uncharacterized protein G2W53_042261 [Senna tora]|uniref:Uncharacterized protein n=1 Tax=Senna tora TaxID=362788 RepID=A0A834VZS8_9FABA|nr:uncharacterized protein G2W53_042261 [Senna tora]